MSSIIQNAITFFRIISVSTNYIYFSRFDLSNGIVSRAFLRSATATASITIESRSNKATQHPRRGERSRKPTTKLIESLVGGKDNDVPTSDNTRNNGNAQIDNDLSKSTNSQSSDNDTNKGKTGIAC